MNISAADRMDSEWIAESERRIEKYRKGEFVLQLDSGHTGSTVAVRLVRHHFQFGMCLGGNPESDAADEMRYFDFVRTNFNTVVMENAAKWYATEKEPGQLTYEAADRFARWAEQNGLNMRGHCLFWSKPKYVQGWVQALDETELRTAVERRLESVVARYRGKFTAWDVNNEMLDGSFYLDRLGPDIRPWMFRRAHELDPATPLYVNEYSILGCDVKTGRYIAMIRELQAAGAPVGGVGIQEHAAERLVRGMRQSLDDRPERAEWVHIHPREAWRSLDQIGVLGLPVQLTEISARTPDQQERADAIETILRVGFAHPAVEMILLWGFWERRHWLGKEAALVDSDFNLLPAGLRYRELVHDKWSTRLEGLNADSGGQIEFRGFYGVYEISGITPGGEAWKKTVEFTPEQLKR